MAISDGQVLKAVVEMVLEDGTISQNVYHFICNFLTDQDASDILDAIEQYVEDIYGSIAAYLNDGMTFNPILVDKIDWNATEGLWEVEGYVGARTPTVTITNTDDPLPNQMAGVLVANTLRPKSRGRKFFPGLVETSALQGDLIAAALTAFTTALNHYLADETVTSSNVLSPGVPREDAGTFLEFTVGVVNSILGTQRRRKPGVGA